MASKRVRPGIALTIATAIAVLSGCETGNGTVASANRLPSTVDPAIAAATVLVERHGTVSGQCTGVLVTAQMVATASHCLADETLDTLRVMVGGEERPALSIVHRGRVIIPQTGDHIVSIEEAVGDWMLIEIAAVDVAPVQVAALNAAEINAAIADGAGVTAVGFSGRQRHLVQPCRLTQAPADGLIALACNLHPGDSGAPLFLMTDDGLRLIALARNGANAAGVSYAVSALQFASLIRP